MITQKVCCLASSLLLMLPTALNAQNILPSSKAPLIIKSASTKTVSGDEQEIEINVLGKSSYSISPSDKDWMSFSKNATGATFKLRPNYGVSRNVSLTFNNSDGTQSKTISLTQEGSQTVTSALSVAGDDLVKATSASSSIAGHGTELIQNTIDGDLNTKYHSNWYIGITESNPDELIYTFEGDNHIDYINYFPRQDNSINGRFGLVDVYYKLEGQNNFTLLGNYDFKMKSSNTRVELGTSSLDNVREIKLIVKSGGTDSNLQFASCAEMQFCKISESNRGYFSLFADEILSVPNPKLTQAIVDTVSNPFFKTILQEMLDGKYSTEYRVNEVKCILNPATLSAEWNTPGKLYDQMGHVTGVMLSRGKNIIMVSGIPDDIESLPMKCMGWYWMPTDAESAASTEQVTHGYHEQNFTLHNGLNIIDRSDCDWDGLAYIQYFSTTPEKYTNNKVKIHFLNAVENGILSPEKSNDKMQSVLDKAPYQIIDLVGSKVHSVWEVSALKQYTVGKYRQYLNVLDTIIAWEHRLLGFEKYGRIPENKTFAYVNYSFYMFQGGYGVSYMYNTQNRVCNPTNIINNDDDAVWGLSHEWGHQHQMQPYFCWAGLSESSNNMNSCYNVLHMGYAGNRILSNWQIARNLYLDDIQVTSNKIQYGNGSYSSARRIAYSKASSTNSPWSWNSYMQAQALEMADSLVYPQAENVDKAVSINECYVEQNLAPFYMLYTYFTQKGIDDGTGKTNYDFGPDMYESLRGTDTDDDKYAMLAGAQNGKDERYNSFAANYPTSCWVGKGYVSTNSSTWQNSVPYIFNYVRKASKLCGYNLYPYFEKWGFFRIINLYIGDYGDKYYCLMSDMKDEFKTDMENLNLKVMSSNMINEIATIAIPQFETPVIPN